MKFRRTSIEYLALLMAFLTFHAPVVVIAQQTTQLGSEIEEPFSSDPREDAKEDFKSLMWFAIGTAIPAASGVVGWSIGGDGSIDEALRGLCIGIISGCVLTTIIANASPHTIPSARLLGKSPEYVDLYTQMYKDKIRVLRWRTVTRGCALVSTVGILAVLITQL